MRRVTRGVALAASLALTLAACGGSDDTGSGAEAESGTSLLIWADEKRAAPLQELATQWGEDNGVDVTVQQVDFNGMKDTFLQQAPAGQGPDIMLGANDWAGEFVPSGLVSPVQLGANQENFTAAAVEAFTVQGNTYAVPVATENIALFRNPALAPDAPATIDEMADVGLALQKAGKTQYPIGIPIGESGDAYHAFPFYSAAGAYFFAKDADGNYDTSLEGLGVCNAECMTFAKAWAGLGKSGAVKATFDGNNILDAFITGKAPYFITGPWNLTAIQDSKVEFVVEAVPGWEGIDSAAVPIVGAQGFYLNAKSTNQTTAQAFLDATMTTEFMDDLFAADPRPPAWKESAATAASDPIIKAFGDFGADGFPNLPIPEMGPVYEELGLAEKRILEGGDPTTEMEKAQANIEKRLAE